MSRMLWLWYGRKKQRQEEKEERQQEKEREFIKGNGKCFPCRSIKDFQGTGNQHPKMWSLSATAGTLAMGPQHHFSASLSLCQAGWRKQENSLNWTQCFLTLAAGGVRKVSGLHCLQLMWSVPFLLPSFPTQMFKGSNNSFSVLLPASERGVQDKYPQLQEPTVKHTNGQPVFHRFWVPMHHL